MARVTVEDCVIKIPNRFELVALSSRRAKDIGSGTPITVDRDNDKDPVVALREIADGTVNPDKLREDIIQSLQRRAKPDVIDMDASKEQEQEERLKHEITEEVRSLAIDDASEDDFSFSEENLDVDD